MMVFVGELQEVDLMNQIDSMPNWKLLQQLNKEWNVPSIYNPLKQCISDQQENESKYVTSFQLLETRKKKKKKPSPYIYSPYIVHTLYHHYILFYAFLMTMLHVSSTSFIVFLSYCIVASNLIYFPHCFLFFYSLQIQTSI